MNKKILILGGTGLIGQTIRKIIAERNPDLKIVIGSRKESSNPEAIQLDVNDATSFEKLNNQNISLILICTKDSQNNALQYCIEHKIDYIDITKPSPELLKAHALVKNLNLNSKVVFSSGWMGGIVPSLVYATGIAPNTLKSIKIFVYYSTKDKAGASSADFMAENASKPFMVYQNHLPAPTRHFLNAEKHTFTFDNQTRKVFDFDIPDLYLFNTIENVPTVSAKLTFDSRFINTILEWIQKARVFSILNFNEKKKIFGGSGSGALSAFEVVFENLKSEKKKIALKCEKGQSELTAFSTVLHVEKMLENTNPKGIYFSHQLHDSKHFTNLLTSNNSISIKSE